MKKIGDLLSIGLIGISLWVLTGIKWLGVVGAIVTLIVEIYFLYETIRKW